MHELLARNVRRLLDGGIEFDGGGATVTFPLPPTGSCPSCGWWCGGTALSTLATLITGTVSGAVAPTAGPSVTNGPECESNNCTSVAALYGETEVAD